jgi:geranylgeranyl diphosphate/geranylgeranyl-bacteriochlorophyllide a reductase
MLAKRIAIVGGGPAGAFAAAQLAQAGREVLLFDEKLAWEKPCGGGLTDKAIVRWPFLREAQVERNWITHCELIAPSGRKVSFQLDRHIAIFSRLTLNSLLLERAREAGTQLIRERIVKVSGNAGEWTLHSSSTSYGADFVVLAAGARNSFRAQFSQALGPENFMVAVGYYIPGTHHTVQVKFPKDLHGYIWVFPRSDHFSAGICGRMDGKNTAELRPLLEDSLREFGLGLEGSRFYAHIIPSLTVSALQKVAFCGEGWAMIGDAAGFVDAITGEGLFYALRSAELLSCAVLENSPESYPVLVKEDFLPELEHASRIADRFYRGEWMGGAVIERMVQLTARSPQFRGLMRDLFAGAQEYSGLRQRLYRSLPKIAAEALASILWQPGRAKQPSPETASLGSRAGNGKPKTKFFAGAGNRT